MCPKCHHAVGPRVIALKESGPTARESPSQLEQGDIAICLECCVTMVYEGKAFRVFKGTELKRLASEHRNGLLRALRSYWYVRLSRVTDHAGHPV